MGQTFLGFRAQSQVREQHRPAAASRIARMFAGSREKPPVPARGTKRRLFEGLFQNWVGSKGKPKGKPVTFEKVPNFEKHPGV